MQITLRDDIKHRVLSRAKEEDRSPTQVVNRFLEQMPTLAQEKTGVHLIPRAPVHPVAMKINKRAFMRR
jgi:hypothetical protein